jgi:Ca2+-transporting ATPase
MTLVETIHSGVSGRTRYRITGLQQDPIIKSFLLRELSANADIQKISASTITGNMLVSYNSDNTPKTIASLIEKTLSQYDPDAYTSGNGGPCGALHPIIHSGGNGQDADSPLVTGDNYTLQGLWHHFKRKKVLAHMGADKHRGLCLDDVYSRQKLFGPNRLPQSEPRTGWEIFIDQMNSLPVYLLGAAAGVSLLTGGLLDAVVIMGVVAANAVIGYATENKAEQTIHALKKLVRPTADVIRDGKPITVPAEEVVIGDLLILKPGMYVAADCRVVKASHLSIDESMLTGESMPVYKHSKPIKRRHLPLADRRNMAYMGTLVTGGQGLAVAVATGRWTEIGHLQIMLDQTRPPQTPIERQLGSLGDQLVLMCMGICGLIFVVGYLRGYGLLRMLRMSISLAAAAVPEGLPAAATINFAMGINRMRKNRVLIRHLQAVETLGAVQVICMDKTGTLTLNQMTVQQLHMGGIRVLLRNGTLLNDDGTPINASDPTLQQLIVAIALCHEVKINGRSENGDVILHGSSTEKALLHLAMDTGLDLIALRRSYRQLKVKHRSESRLFMSTLHRTDEGNGLYCMKGSPPEVLAMCDQQMVGGEIRPLGEKERKQIETENEGMAGRALRVLGFAYKSVKTGEKGPREEGLIWLGLVGMADPVRPGAASLIKKFQAAGVETVMITGDQNTTAHAVAKDLDLAFQGPLEIFDSSDFRAIDPETLQALAKKVNVYSRVSPAHKLKIVQALQAAGKTVAMTGDGINDGPALKAADIGIAMGRTGTDVARDVADIVLQEDQLDILAQALGDGRTIYGNIRKSVHFFLATNISEILLMLSAMAIGVGFPLTVMQLLWINLISDIFPALALALEAPEPGIMERKPRDGHAPLFSTEDYKQMVRESAAITGGAMAAYGFGLSRYGLGIRSTTLAFQSLTIGQLLHAISCRSENSSIYDRTALKSNTYLTMAVGGSLALQVLTQMVGPLRRFLGLSPAGLMDTAVIAITSILPLLLNEAVKKEPGNQDGS